MGELSRMPNIGKIGEESLLKAGIESPDELLALGSKEAFLRIRLVEPDACLHKLYALEGAVQNVKKSELPKETKKELKDFFNSL
ncbi:MAG: TfoX/Sxy family protein [Bacillota bacterium]